MEQDWDNLIILDACRWDVFSDRNTLNGELQKVVSRGGKTSEFMEKTFDGRQLWDTVYVTGNGNIEKFNDEIFYAVKKTYSNNMNHTKDGFLPNIVFEAAKDAYEEHPDKRLLIHFLQPHAPYLGPTADNLREQLREEKGLKFRKTQLVEGDTLSEVADLDENRVVNTLMDAERHGYISSEQLREVYAENLQVVLEYVEDLVSILDGKTVITSDHGELLGSPSGMFTKVFEPPKYSHRRQTWVPELRFVPWLEIEATKRREVVREEPIGGEEVDEGNINHNLYALGYID